MNSKVMVVIIFLVSAGYAHAQQSCRELHGANSNQLVAYLESDQRATECVILALRQLGSRRAEEAAPVLTRFLDLRRPWTTEEKLGVSTKPLGIFERYPASESLFSIGKPALPALVQAIKESALSEIARQNAIYTIMLIHRQEPRAGIKFLKTQVASSNNPEQRKRLSDAAALAVRWCSLKKQECEAELNVEPAPSAKVSPQQP